MLSPPNQGSELSEKFGEDALVPIFCWGLQVHRYQKRHGIISGLHALHESVGFYCSVSKLESLAQRLVTPTE